MFSVELRESTRKVHQDVEKKLLAQIKNIQTVDDYVQLLVLMYGFYVPLQQKVEPFLLHESNGYNTIRHRKTGREAFSILTDITFLAGKAPANLPVADSLPEVNSYPAALGCLYVSEGSTIGGRIIADIISKKLNISPSKGFAFFNAYGNETEEMWANFKQILNGPFTAEQRNEITAAAISTFNHFNDWINLYESATNEQV